jgi:lipopolysaccharide transport system permease protein
MQSQIEITIADEPTIAERRRPGPTVSIRADSKAPILNIPELWAYRQVLHALVRREIKIRYAQTVVGIGWALLQPALTTFVLTVLAGRWMRGPIGGVNYSVFVFAGLVPWIYFTHVVTRSSVCLMNNNGLLSKAYFPRLLLPLAAAIGGLVDLLVMTVILVLLMAYTRTSIGFGILFFPLCLLFLGTVAAGAGIWIAVLNLYHRDVAHALPFVTQLAFFLTPVAYASTLVPHSWRLTYALNPMAGVVECFRWSLFAATPDVPLGQLGASALVGIVSLLSALVYFSRKERILADVGDA